MVVSSISVETPTSLRVCLFRKWSSALFPIQNEAQLSEADMRDGFSTLFAVKLPDQKGLYDSKAYPLEYLLRGYVLNYLSTNQEPAQQSRPYVYLKSEDPMDLDLKQVPYPIMQ